MSWPRCRSRTDRPSAGAPAAIRYRRAPSGWSRSRTPRAQGRGSTSRIGTDSQRRHRRDQGALHDHREGDHHDDDLVGVVLARRVGAEEVGAEQDRDGALEPGPEHEQPLAGPQPGRPQQRARPTSGRTTSVSSTASSKPISQALLLTRVGQRDREPQRDESDDLGQARQGGMEPLDVGLERGGGVAQQDAGDEHGEESRPVRPPSPARTARSRPPGSAAGRGPRWAGAAVAARRAARTPRPTPTAAPTTICRANSPSTPAAAVSPRLDPAPSRLTRRAIPTGSLAPDSPSRMTPVRPSTSQLPSTENTTAGSVGASAVPTSSATGHGRPATR